MADRTQVVPVTLTFACTEERVLLLRVAPGKPHFGGFLNGLGGHVHPGEDVREAARREVREESGLILSQLELRCVLHEMDLAPRDRLVFVFRADLPEATEPVSSREGRVAWYPRAGLPWDELVPDLRELLPHALGGEPLAFATVRYRGDPSAYELVIR